MADIPGLIEGASEGLGLGHDFLRHVERTRMLIHVLDVSGFEGRDPVEDFEIIMGELERYSEELARRPMIVAANKMDIPPAEENLARLREYLEEKGIEVFPVSAATNQGLLPLMRKAAAMVDDLPEPDYILEDFQEEEILEDRTFSIDQVEEGVFEVNGPLAEDIMRRVNLGDRDSLSFFAKMLEQNGIVDALRQHGAKDGDTVIMAETEFDFVD